jgi:Ca2+-binding RTX toxin-like protein
MKKIHLIAAATVATLAVTATPAGAAVAGTTVLDNTGLIFAADPGENNRLTVSMTGGTVVFEDSAAPITAGRDCTNETPNRVVCTNTAGGVSVTLEDGDDEATLDDSLTGLGEYSTVGVSGGRGNDTLRAAAAPAYLNGGLGQDTLTGGTGTRSIDAVEFARAPEAGTIPQLRPERDVVECAPSATDTSYGIDVDTTDQVDPDCMRLTVYSATEVVLTGTPGVDGLSGRFDVPTKIYGLGGDDNLTSSEFDRADGGEGNDDIRGFGLMLGGPGDDDLSVQPYSNQPRARMDGGPGNDVLSGGDSGDSIAPGPGADRVSARRGNDTIRARDGERDTIRCGEGRDTVSADRIDSVARDCEKVSR